MKCFKKEEAENLVAKKELTKEQYRQYANELLHRIEILKNQRNEVLQQRDELLELLRYIRNGAMHEACGYEAPDPTWHCCNWAEVVELINGKLEGAD